jgi:hypothetical protein
MKAQLRNKGIPLFLNLGTRCEWVFNATLRPLHPREKDPLAIAQEVVWALEPVWTPAENLTRTGIRSPARPAHSESLYRLHYRGPMYWQLTYFTAYLLFHYYAVFM